MAAVRSHDPGTTNPAGNLEVELNRQVGEFNRFKALTKAVVSVSKDELKRETKKPRQKRR